MRLRARSVHDRGRQAEGGRSLDAGGVEGHAQRDRARELELRRSPPVAEGGDEGPQAGEGLAAEVRIGHRRPRGQTAVVKAERPVGEDG